jgi:hypothetical protein
MLRNTFIALCMCAALLCSACASGNKNETSKTAASPSPAANQTTPAQATSATQQPQVVTASVGEVTLKSGGSIEAEVLLDIAEGYHVNSNQPSDKFYIATQLEAGPQEGITAGKPVYPPALTKKFSFAEQPLSVYEGRAVIKLPLRAEPAATKGRHTFRTRIRIQPCNDQACLAPRTIEAAIPVVID